MRSVGRRNKRPLFGYLEISFAQRLTIKGPLIPVMQVGDHPQSLRAVPAAVCIGVAALGCSNEEGRLGARAALCANMVEPFRGDERYQRRNSAGLVSVPLFDWGGGSSRRFVTRLNRVTSILLAAPPVGRIA